MSRSVPCSPEEFPASFGRYRLVKLLGKGGMGSVYLARDPQLDRTVALKVPLLDGEGDAQLLARFHHEARAAAALSHPNICPIHEVGEVDGLPYITMGYVEGKSLADRSKGRALQPRQSAALVRKLALALEEAHRRKVIHRDLKPANVMIDKRGEPVIMDFGLARRLRKGDVRLTQAGEVLGTPAYMPPEQIQGELDTLGPAADIYSLGVILYELLAGRIPFSGGVAAVMTKALSEEPPPPSQFVQDVPPDLEAICLKAMAKKIADRHTSMADLADELAAHLRNKPADPGEGPRSGSGRRLALGIVGGVAAAAFIGAIAYRATDYGSIRIEYSPKTAHLQIQVDGQPVESADAELRLVAGEHRLLVSGPDCANEERDFSVHRGQNASLQVTLRPKPVAAGMPKIDRPPFNNLAKVEPKAPETSKIEPKVEPKAAPKVVSKVLLPVPVPPGTTLAAFPASTAKLMDDLMESELAKIGCSAGVVGVARNDVTLYLKAYGWCDKEKTTPAKTDTMFAAGFFRNRMVQISARQLVDKKRLDGDAAIYRYLNVAAAGKVVDPRVLKITVKNVVDQRPGWDEDTIKAARKIARAQNGDTPSVETLLGILATQKLKDGPGANESAAGFCIEIMSELIAKSTGRNPNVYFRTEMLGRDIKGIGAPRNPKGKGTMPLWNAVDVPTAIAAPAVLEIMRTYSWDGSPDGRAGWYSSYNANHANLAKWRNDGIRIIVMFNGNRRDLHDDLLPAVQHVLSTFKSASGEGDGARDR